MDKADDAALKNQSQVCFKLISDMKRHMTTHPKFNCEHCDLKFASKFSSQRHKETHHNLKFGLKESNMAFYKDHFISRVPNSDKNVNMNNIRTSSPSISIVDNDDTFTYDLENNYQFTEIVNDAKKLEESAHDMIEGIIGDLLNITASDYKVIAEALLNNLIKLF